jgi:type IV conjugative transfer system coupling protein TraD
MIFKTFIRGGQTSLHSIRMAKQLLKIMVVSSFFIVSSVSYFKTNKEIPQYQMNIFISYAFAKGYVAFGLEEKEIPITHFTGRRELYRSIDLINDANIIYTKNIVLKAFIKNIIFSIKLFLILFLIIGGYFVYKGNKLGSLKHLRGSKLKDIKQITKEIIRYNRKKFFSGERKTPYKSSSKNIFRHICPKIFSTYDYSVAKVPYPCYTESLHTMITGAPGTGKTQIILDILEQVRRNNDKAIVYDRTGILTSCMYNEETDIILNPLDERSPYWSIFNEAESEIHFNTMASAFLPYKGEQDKFWVDAARTIFSEVCNVLSKNVNPTNDELIKAVLKTDIDKVSKLLQEADVGDFLINKDSPKTALSVMSVLTTNIRPLKYLRKESGNEVKSFSIRDWVKNDKDKGFLFISSRADQHETLMPLISLWMEIAINSILSLKQSRNRKLWIIIDELPSLHYIPSLHSGLAEGRQFGAAFVLGMQLMAQLRSIYGKDKAESTSGLCGTRVILATPDEETAKWCSDNLGKMEVEEMRESISYGANDIRDGVSMSKQEHIKHIVLPSEIMNMKNLRAYVKPAEDFGVTLSDFKYKKRKEVAESFIPHGSSMTKMRLDTEPESFPPPSEPKEEEDKIKFVNSKGDGYTGMMNNANYFNFNNKNDGAKMMDNQEEKITVSTLKTVESVEEVTRKVEGKENKNEEDIFIDKDLKEFMSE